ncbi:hypothetical protein Tco_1477493 [Tanacetum coccineum]
MVTVPIHQASTSVPPLSTPIIDLSPPKSVSSPLQEPVISANTKATTATLPLLPPLQQQSTTDSSLASRVLTLEQRCADLENKHKLQDQTTQALLSRMFESGTYKSLPKHVALYEALEASMERANKNEFLAEKDKSRKRPPSSSSKQKSVPHSEQPAKEVPILEDVNISDLEDTDTAHLPKIKTRPDWLKHVPEEDIPKTPETDWIIPPNDLPDIENN